MKKIVFSTFITENYKNKIVEFDLFFKSFKKYHPDIDLVVFQDNHLDYLKAKNPNFSFVNWKNSLAKEFYDDYETVVILDSDHFVFDRLDEILNCDYDVAVPSNYNSYLNVDLKLAYCAAFDLSTNSTCYELAELVPQDEFYQGGLVAGKKDFWQKYDFACNKHANKIGCLGENSVLNILLSMCPFNFKILDGAKRFTDENFSTFYSCASLNLEKNFYLKNDKLFCFQKPVKLYHVANGEKSKKRFNQLFSEDIQKWFYNKIN